MWRGLRGRRAGNSLAVTEALSPPAAWWLSKRGVWESRGNSAIRYSPAYTAWLNIRKVEGTSLKRLWVISGLEVCYDKLGCFSDSAPWSGTSERPLKALPWSPSKINTRFLLYTNENPDNFQVGMRSFSRLSFLCFMHLTQIFEPSNENTANGGVCVFFNF